MKKNLTWRFTGKLGMLMLLFFVLAGFLEIQRGSGIDAYKIVPAVRINKYVWRMETNAP